MRTRYSDDLVLAFKDQLRSVRYKIQRDARGAKGDGRVDVLVPAPVAVATDAVFTQFQAAATALLPKDEVALYAFTFPQPASAYFAPDRQDPDALTPKIYSALKTVLRRFGSDVSLISEQAIHEACEQVRARQSRAIAAALDPALSAADRFDACVKLCAALSLALAASRPVREAIGAPDKRGAPNAPFLAPNVYCALVIGLAIALASRADVEGADAQGLAEAADLAVHARLEELSAAVNDRQPLVALAAEFKDLLRFLP